MSFEPNKNLYRVWPWLFRDDFTYSGAVGLPGSESIPDHWTIVSGDWTTRSERYLKVDQPGELLYNGDSLYDMKLTKTTNANFSFDIGFRARDELKIEIRARRSDADNFVSFFIDFENQQIQLKKTVATVETVLATESHILRYKNANEEIYYGVTFWLYEDALMGYVNNYPFIQATLDFNTTVEDWSIYVPEMYTDEEPIFVYTAATEVKAYPDAPIYTSSVDLYLQFRLKLIEQIENPSVRDWASLKTALDAWERGKDIGRLDEEWAELGYPVFKPTPEAWFGKL